MATTTPKVARPRAVDEVEQAPTLESPTEATGSFDGPAYAPAQALLAHFGRWQGDDLEALLEEVYETRSKVSW
jgi:hypothetical protein